MPKLDEVLFNLKLTSKQLQRQSKKCSKNEAAALKKVEEAIRRGNTEGARIYAQNAIREKQQALNLLRLSSRVDAVASRVETAVSMGAITKEIKGVVKGMDKALASMDPEKVSMCMAEFEAQFDKLDLTAGVLEDAVGSSTSSTVPSDEVTELLHMVADKAGLELAAEFDAAGRVGVARPAAAAETAPRRAVAVGADGGGQPPRGAGDGGAGGGHDGGGGDSGGDIADALSARLAALRK